MSKILLVDDDVDLAELLQARLSAEGHEVHVINTGEGAFELAKRIKPEIALLDIMLPGVTGYEICRKLRKDPELYRLGILLLTALGEEPEVAHGLEQGADDYLAKPFRLEKLIDKLSGLADLVETTRKRNPVTNLPGTEAVKREINHRLARNAPTAACYIDVVGYKGYAASRGSKGQRDALVFLATKLTQLTRSAGVYECFVAHLGGEHFVVVLNVEDYERFCNTLMQDFDQTVTSLYTPDEVARGYIIAKDRHGRELSCPVMALAIGVAHTQYRKYKSAQKVFEVLAQVRQMAEPRGKSKVFVDRRRTDR